MSDDAAKHFEVHTPTTPGVPEGKSVSVTITLHPNGQIECQMPAANKILAYGLLESARAQLDKLYLLDEVKQAQASRGGIEGLLKRINGGG